MEEVIGPEEAASVVTDRGVVCIVVVDETADNGLEELVFVVVGLKDRQWCG